MLYYRQCKLQRGSSAMITWIPEKFSKKGKFLKIKNEGTWEDGWQVVERYEHRRSSEEISDTERDYLTQRSMSDI